MSDPRHDSRSFYKFAKRGGDHRGVPELAAPESAEAVSGTAEKCRM
jgi:hypothetical protein